MGEERRRTRGGASSTSSYLMKIVQNLFDKCGCVSFSPSKNHFNPNIHPTSPTYTTSPKKDHSADTILLHTDSATDHISTNNKTLCAICLDPLNYSSATSPGQAIFTAQCSHSFHFTCISSNVRHGGVTCPICRAHWTQLPRNLIAPALTATQSDPVLQILDDSIATFRIHRRSFLRSARYDDDDPIEPENTTNHPRLRLTLLSVPSTHTDFNSCLHQISELDVCQICGISSKSLPKSSSSSSAAASPRFHPTNRTYLGIKLAHQPATDLVLVASPNGPHLRLMKQYMALVVFSMRPTDRLAIVAYSTATARVFPLRRMTSYGKRTALQVIDRLFYMGQADPVEGLKKGVKILGDRTHENLESCILHLSGSPTRSYHGIDMEVPIPIHRFHVGYGFGTSNGTVMHEFEEFLARVLGGAIRDVQLRIGEDDRIIMLGELRGGEERRIPLDLNEHGYVCVDYSYIDGGADECIQTGEILVGLEDKHDRSEGVENFGSLVGRTSNSETLDYHDPYMARRWAKHLHGYRI